MYSVHIHIAILLSKMLFILLRKAILALYTFHSKKPNTPKISDMYYSNAVLMITYQTILSMMNSYSIMPLMH